MSGFDGWYRSWQRQPSGGSLLSVPPEFSFAMRSAASFASLLGTVPVRSTDLPFFTSTVTFALARARILLDRGLNVALDVASGGGRSSVTLRQSSELLSAFFWSVLGSCFRCVRRFLLWSGDALKAAGPCWTVGLGRRVLVSAMLRRALCIGKTAAQYHDQCKLIQNVVSLLSSVFRFCVR